MSAGRFFVSGKKRKTTLSMKKHRSSVVFGAGGRIRTPDLLITNQLHYQLCYTSIQTA